MFTKESVSNPEYMQDYFSRKKIECLKIVPSHWKALRMDEKLLLPAKLLVFGGEALPAEVIEKIRQTNSECMVVNHYGPTETTIGKLLHITEPDMKYDSTIPIGKPFSNTRVYVLSNAMEVCPVGVPGQLYIAGDGVARGYLNNTELTNEKFIENPYLKNKKTKAGKSLFYCTGDLVKYLPDGNIEFIGRADTQVKIRGYRIELGEIENVLQQCETVSEAAVVAKEDVQGNKRLAAYIVPKEKFDKEAISSFLKDILPEYMMPSFFVEMERMPLMSNGKINRKALPDPEMSELLSGQLTSPRNEAEIILAEIWQDLLGLDTVGIHDNFFELGGDSIITIQLVSRARRAGYELQIGDVFTYQTIARLSALLDQRSEDLKTVGEQFELTGACGLLPIQQWFFEKEHKDISHFNQSVLLEIDKGVTEPVLKRAIEQLKEHHDALRFKYFKKDGKWNQVYEPESEVSGLITEDLQSSSQDALRSLISLLQTGISGVWI
ncbi:MAG: AMP-binding protein [Ignavibacteria bacterium]|nr:AMP-binding protein [Ignavibacteria bacterium]